MNQYCYIIVKWSSPFIQIFCLSHCHFLLFLSQEPNQDTILQSVVLPPWSSLVGDNFWNALYMWCPRQFWGVCVWCFVQCPQFEYDLYSELCVLGRRTTEINFDSHHIISRVHPIRYDLLPLLMLTLIIWLEVVVVSCLHREVTVFPPFPYCSVWKKVTMCHLRSGELSSTSLRAEYLNKL